MLGLSVLPLRVDHGRLPILGFRIGNVAYCTDASGLPDVTKERLTGLDTLVLGRCGTGPHPTHYSVGQAIEVARELAPRRTFLTHLSGELEHAETERGPAARSAIGVRRAADPLSGGVRKPVKLKCPRMLFRIRDAGFRCRPDIENERRG